MGEKKYIPIAKIGSPYGIKGWVKIRSFSEASGFIIFDYSPWFLASSPTDTEPAEIKVALFRMHAKTLIVKFVGYENPEKTRQLTGKFILILRSQLPALNHNEYYWCELEGLTVIDQTGKELGKVAYLLATGANDVIVVEQGKKQFAIPYLPGKVILKVDLPAKKMIVNWELI